MAADRAISRPSSGVSRPPSRYVSKHPHQRSPPAASLLPPGERQKCLSFTPKPIVVERLSYLSSSATRRVCHRGGGGGSGGGGGGIIGASISLVGLFASSDEAAAEAVATSSSAPSSPPIERKTIRTRIKLDNPDRPEATYAAVQPLWSWSELYEEVRGVKWGDFKPKLADAIVSHLEPTSRGGVRCRTDPPSPSDAPIASVHPLSSPRATRVVVIAYAPRFRPDQEEIDAFFNGGDKRCCLVDDREALDPPPSGVLGDAVPPAGTVGGGVSYGGFPRPSQTSLALRRMTSLISGTGSSTPQLPSHRTSPKEREYARPVRQALAA